MKKQFLSLPEKMQHCDAFRRSGLRPSEYCKQNGISASSLWRWQRLDSGYAPQFKRVEVEQPDAVPVKHSQHTRYVAHVAVKHCEVYIHSGASQQDVATLIRAIAEVY